ncbi:MAG: hypothetical protein FD146_2649 [Anaerolineaceae bacterium]|nr:MAG: hypothetical protein FD146_2649 [Anaerolineaceae bacterium]
MTRFNDKERAQFVRNLVSRIAHRYDLMNR